MQRLAEKEFPFISAGYDLGYYSNLSQKVFLSLKEVAGNHVYQYKYELDQAGWMGASNLILFSGQLIQSLAHE